MKHQGQELETRIKAKGFSIKGIADAIGITRVAVEKHLKLEVVSRKVLSRYTEPLGFTADGFYAECDGPVGVVLAPAPPDAQSATYWRSKYYDLLERYNLEMEEQAKLVRSVFIKAAPLQQATA